MRRSMKRRRQLPAVAPVICMRSVTGYWAPHWRPPNDARKDRPPGSSARRHPAQLRFFGLAEHQFSFGRPIGIEVSPVWKIPKADARHCQLLARQDIRAQRP